MFPNTSCPCMAKLQYNALRTNNILLYESDKTYLLPEKYYSERDYFLWDLITRPYPNFRDGGLAGPLLKLGHA